MISFEANPIPNALIGFKPRGFVSRVIFRDRSSTDGESREYKVAKYLSENMPAFGYNGHMPYVSLTQNNGLLLVRYPYGLNLSRFSLLLNINIDRATRILGALNTYWPDDPVTLPMLLDEFAISSRTNMQIQH